MKIKNNVEIREKYKNKIRSIVFDDITRKGKYEIMGNLQVAISLVLIKKLDVYIYGAAGDISAFVKFLKSEDIKVKKIVDIDNKKAHKNIGGIEIITVEEFKDTMTNPGNVFVFILTSFFTGMLQMDICKILGDVGVNQFYAVEDNDKHIISTSRNVRADYGRDLYYKNNIEKIEEFIDLLEDDYSLETLTEYIRTYCEYDNWSMPEIKTKYKYFFGCIDGNVERIYEHKDNEVWLNCGACVGDTVFAYHRLGLPCKQIIAVEGESSNYIQLCDNIKKLPDNLAKLVVPKQLMIDSSTDFDNLLEGEKLTLVNADIEGAELNFLHNISSKIVSDRPVLAICLYHKKEDIVNIPSYINSIVDNYSFYLRKYASGFKIRNRNHELVLYAVPKERDIKDMECK